MRLCTVRRRVIGSSLIVDHAKVRRGEGRMLVDGRQVEKGDERGERRKVRRRVFGLSPLPIIIRLATIESDNAWIFILVDSSSDTKAKLKEEKSVRREGRRELDLPPSRRQWRQGLRVAEFLPELQNLRLRIDHELQSRAYEFFSQRNATDDEARSLQLEPARRVSIRTRGLSRKLLPQRYSSDEGRKFRDAGRKKGRGGGRRKKEENGFEAKTPLPPLLSKRYLQTTH